MKVSGPYLQSDFSALFLPFFPSVAKRMNGISPYRGIPKERQKPGRNAHIQGSDATKNLLLC